MSKLGKHTSLDKELKHGIKWFTSNPDVKRIILGEFEPARTKYPKGHFRFQRDVVGGIVLNGYGGNGVMRVTLILAEGKKESVLQKMKEKFGEP